MVKVTEFPSVCRSVCLSSHVHVNRCFECEMKQICHAHPRAKRVDELYLPMSSLSEACIERCEDNDAALKSHLTMHHVAADSMRDHMCRSTWLLLSLIRRSRSGITGEACRQSPPRAEIYMLIHGYGYTLLRALQ